MAPSTTSRSVPSRFTGTILLLTIAASLAGCGSGEEKDPSSPSKTAPASTAASSDPNQKAKDDVLAAYTNMREVQISMARDGDLHTLDLTKYAKGEAAADLKKSVLRNRQLGIKFTGRPIMDPEVSVGTSRDTATVTDCFDATNWKPVYTSSGKAVPLTKQRLKYPVTSEATLEGGTWLITRITADREKGCPHVQPAD
ncbi:hypothetical protein OG800_49785 (plasmid) [Streptomyces sp. NBC_00445]|uniref:hypothetical protein n=1 Tax=Streptomyces sp. NBC_00445 TaxID=2975745 RepID=UPI002E1F083E